MKAKFACHGERAKELIRALLPFARQLAPMLELDGVTITAEKFKPRRSSDANARYWAIVGALADHVGYTKEELHEAILCEFAGYDVVQFRDYEVKRPLQRSSKLASENFSSLMAIAERWAVEAEVIWEEVA